MSGRGGRLQVLNVAEKPSVAKAVSEILSRHGGGGAMRSREGRSRYNRIYEFEFAIRGQPCHMLFTSVTGHLMELEFDERYRRWHSCDPAELYHAPVQKHVPQDKLDLKASLELEARKCQWLVLWLDCDREGENIAFEVVDVCTAVNPHLNIWRARFSALIDREIHDSVQNLVRPNKLFSDAVDARQEIDLRIGASFTRFQTMLLKDAFVISSDDERVILSYGPCQFPTLGFIVERYWEIQAHEPEEFWAINCTHVVEDESANFNWLRGHLFDYTSALILYEMCVEQPTATVVDVKHQEKFKYPPYPLSTLELQKRASRHFRMSSEHTMKVAEELYQAGFISYPRTETDGFSPNMNLQAIVQEQLLHPSWGEYAQRLLDPEARLWRNPSSGGHDDKAHPPIHPTKYSSGEAGWTQDKLHLYELVVRHFLACVSQPAKGAETTVSVDISGEQFVSSGRVILERNYLDVYRFESWGGSVIPAYSIGQQFIPTTLTLDSGVTRPPPLLSESDLLSCMDKAGIGTDATMHDHIKKLLDRSYATKDASTRFAPTNLGEALVMGYDDMGYELWKPYLRSMMECDMKEVSLGTKTKDQILENCLRQMKACFLDARVNRAKLIEAMALFFQRSDRSNGVPNSHIAEVVRPCGLCRDSNMALKKKPDGSYMVGCSNFPSCRNVVWLPGAIADATVTTSVCNACNPGPVYKIQFKFCRREIPPNYDVDHLGCIGGCDEVLKELTEICGTGSRNVSAGPAGQRGTESHTAQRGNPGERGTDSHTAQRGNLGERCTNCQQTGHSAYNCHSQISSSMDPQLSRPSRVSQRQTSSSGDAQLSRSSRVAQRRNGRQSVMCGSCGETCALRTANTATNRGRKFYRCPSPGCDFFIWEDELGSDRTLGQPTPRENGRPPSRGRAGRGRGQRTGRSSDFSFVTATGEPVGSGRNCYICGDPSHFANACPNRGS